MRHFLVSRPGSLTLEDLTLTGGRADDSHAAGGAIFMRGGGLNLVRATLDGNFAEGRGGAIRALEHVDAALPQQGHVGLRGPRR